MKPTFLLFAGSGWSGTTSLYYTLYILNKCVHGGITKEDGLLMHSARYDILSEIYGEGMEILEPFQTLRKQQKATKNLICNRYRKLHSNTWPSINATNTLKELQPDFIKVNQVLKNVSLDDLDNIFSKLDKEYIKIEDYVNYQKLVSDAVGKEFNSITTDFTNANYALPKEHYIKLKPLLEEYFNVKVLMILRDPVRRYFSSVQSSIYWDIDMLPDPTICKRSRSEMKRLGFNSVVEYFEYLLKGIPFGSNFPRYNQNSTLSNPLDYATNIKMFQDVFGKENFHLLIMEDFFAQKNGSVESLEQYLNIKLDKGIVPCCFVPDKGINAPRIEGLKDQWDSDHEKLEPENYYKWKKIMQSVYNDFEELYGFLPADWGQPIDYGY